jgi:two-component sensor histidine kinase
MRADDLSMAGALEGLATQVATQPRSLIRQLEIGFLAATTAIIFRSLLDPIIGDHLPFSAFFPALLVGSVFGGLAGGLLALVMTTLGGWFVFLPPRLSWDIAAGKGSQIPVYLVVGGLMVFGALVLRGALIRLETHRRRHEALVGELHSRLVKDLAVVAAIAHQTLRSSPEPVEFRHAFTDRLAILRDTHSALWLEDWRAMSLRQIVGRPLRLFAPSEAGRILMEGPEILVHPDLAINLALCVRELAANAMRHGALSVPDGRVRIEWTQNSARVDFAWVEIGGPPRTSEPQKGFGFDLLERRFGEGLRWDCEWLPGLLRWSVAFASDGGALPATATAAAQPFRPPPAHRRPPAPHRRAGRASLDGERRGQAPASGVGPFP